MGGVKLNRRGWGRRALRLVVLLELLVTASQLGLAHRIEAKLAEEARGQECYRLYRQAMGGRAPVGGEGLDRLVQCRRLRGERP